MSLDSKYPCSNWELHYKEAVLNFQKPSGWFVSVFPSGISIN
jgi:hypothetical protein